MLNVQCPDRSSYWNNAEAELESETIVSSCLHGRPQEMVLFDLLKVQEFCLIQNKIKTLFTFDIVTVIVTIVEIGMLRKTLATISLS